MRKRFRLAALTACGAGMIPAVLLAVAGDATAATTTFTPVADTYVNANAPSTNYGTGGQLGVDNSPVKRVFLRFTVSGLAGAVTGVKLRLHTDDVAGSQSNAGGTLHRVSSTTWSETAVNWSNQPAVDGATLGSLGKVARNTWYEIDVTSAVTADGTYSFALTSTSSDGADYDSRETGATAPQLVVTTGSTGTTSTTAASTTTTTTPGGDPVLVGAGDIADCGNAGDSATAALLDTIAGTVYTVGDNVYANGTATEFANCYDPTWGRHKARTRPAPGNHDYNTANAGGYYGYFGAAAGDPAKGYYSYDLGSWHVVVVNSNCAAVGGCGAGSAQETWVRQDLAASTRPCTVAYWHHPRFTSGANHGNATEMGPIFQALYDANAELVLSGHNHNYERFAPQTPAGAADAARGIREFVVGTGGESHYGFGTVQPNSEVRNGDTFGVLKLTLKASGYDWQFVPEAGKTFTDSGSGTCH